MSTPTALLTVAEAVKRDAIRKHWQPAFRRYAWSADGCGDNLYSTASIALQAYKSWMLLHVVATEKQIVSEHA